MQFYYVKVKAFLFCLNRKRGNDGGGLTVYVLLSLVNKETALAFDRTAAQIGGVDRTECWEEEGNGTVAMTLLSKTAAGQNPPGKPPPRGATQIIRNGLDQYVRVS